MEKLFEKQVIYGNSMSLTIDPEYLQLRTKLCRALFGTLVHDFHAALVQLDGLLKGKSLRYERARTTKPFCEYHDSGLTGEFIYLARAIVRSAERCPSRVSSKIQPDYVSLHLIRRTPYEASPEILGLLRGVLPPEKIEEIEAWGILNSLKVYFDRKTLEPQLVGNTERTSSGYFNEKLRMIGVSIYVHGEVNLGLIQEQLLVLFHEISHYLDKLFGVKVQKNDDWEKQDHEVVAEANSLFSAYLLMTDWGEDPGGTTLWGLLRDSVAPFRSNEFTEKVRAVLLAYLKDLQTSPEKYEGIVGKFGEGPDRATFASLLTRQFGLTETAKQLILSDLPNLRRHGRGLSVVRQMVPEAVQKVLTEKDPETALWVFSVFSELLTPQERQALLLLIAKSGLSPAHQSARSS